MPYHTEIHFFSFHLSRRHAHRIETIRMRDKFNDLSEVYE